MLIENKKQMKECEENNSKEKDEARFWHTKNNDMRNYIYSTADVQFHSHRNYCKIPLPKSHVENASHTSFSVLAMNEGKLE